MSLLLALTGGGGPTSYADNLSAAAYVIAGKTLSDTVSRADYVISGQDITDAVVPAGGVSYADDLSYCAYLISAGELQDVIDVFEPTGGGGGGRRRKPKRRIHIVNGIRYLLPSYEDIKIEEPEQEQEIVENNYVEEIKRVDFDSYEYVRSAMISRVIPGVKKQVSEKPKTQVKKQDEYEDEELLLMMF